MLEKRMIEDWCMRLERDHPGAPAAATLQHFYTIFRERDEQSALIGELRDALIEAKRSMWSMARDTWTMADFKRWAAVEQIDAVLAKVRSPSAGAAQDQGGEG